MKILTIHADFIEFQAKKKAFNAAEADVTSDKQRVEECLVVFTAFEKRDEHKTPAVLAQYLQEIKNIALQVNAKKIVLYPYAHLSSELGNPGQAEKFLKEAEVQLKGKYTVNRAPFGWYKAFTLSCKGHPLSELSRSFGSGENAEASSSQKTSEKETPVQEKSGKSEAALAREYKDEPFSWSTSELSPAQKINLTAAYLIGMAIQELYPSAELGSAGFYHDQSYIDINNIRLTPENFKKIQGKVKELLQNSVSFEQKGKAQGLQEAIAQDLGMNAQIYTLKDTSKKDSSKETSFVPCYNTPFVKPATIKALKLLNTGSAYWKNNEKNAQLTRIYLIAFDQEQKLVEYEEQQEKAKNRSHLKIGKEQGLFVVSELVGAGLPLLAPRGAIIRQELIDFLWQLHKHQGYQRVAIPHIAKDSLYKASGHWEKFGAELFHVKGAHENFVLKPMNCPHHIQIFANFSYSYRDLPVRFFEPTTVYRDEKPGQLLGLSRVRSITQDDGHIFCRPSQIKQEVKTIVGIILQFYQTIGMDKDYWVSLSVRGEDQTKYLGTPEVWTMAEAALEDVAKTNKLPYKKIKGEAAFYGPKLDFIFKDALGREWQLATIQLDFNLPERFNLGYMNEESKKERPVMIHRAISGSLERFMSVLIEHFAGKFPLWLNPCQIKVLTITDENLPFAHEVVQQLQARDFRVELDSRVESMGKKVRDAQLEQVNYIITIGKKEMDSHTVAIRTRAGEQKFDVPLEKFLKQVEEERQKKML